MIDKIDIMGNDASNALKNEFCFPISEIKRMRIADIINFII